MAKVHPDRVRELQTLLGSGSITVEEARRFLADMENTVDNNSETEYFPGRKPVPDKIAPSSAYHSSSDEQGRCPHCYANGDQRFMGMLTVDGEERPTYHCTKCNKAYAELPAAIKIIMKEMKDAGHQKVGFEPASTPVTANAGQQFDYTLQSNTNNANMKLDQVNSNLNTLNSTIQDLTWKIEELAKQNNKLMAQLATDPLISIRKNVTEFNLR